MLSLGEACSRMLALAEPGEPIEIPLTEAVGLVLAEPAVADVDLPPFDRAGQEGYAVRAGDAAAGGLLRVVGSVAKGRKALVEPAVELQEAARIVVGEPVPYDAEGGPLAAAELAEATRSAVQVLLDESLPTSWWF